MCATLCQGQSQVSYWHCRMNLEIGTWPPGMRLGVLGGPYRALQGCGTLWGDPIGQGGVTVGPYRAPIGQCWGWGVLWGTIGCYGEL